MWLNNCLSSWFYDLLNTARDIITKKCVPRKKGAKKTCTSFFVSDFTCVLLGAPIGHCQKSLGTPRVFCLVILLVRKAVQTPHLFEKTWRDGNFTKRRRCVKRKFKNEPKQKKEKRRLCWQDWQMTAVRMEQPKQYRLIWTLVTIKETADFF